MSLYDDTPYTEIKRAEDVTEEILEIIRGIESGWYSGTPIDWEDVWDRADNTQLADGSYVFFPEIDSPAQRKIQRVIRKERRFG